MAVGKRISFNSLARQIGQDLQGAIRKTALRVRDRGVEIMRAEVPRRSGLLSRGVKGTVSRGNTVTIIASAIAQRKATNATLVLKSGKRKQIRLRAGRRFDYADAVGGGTGLFGPTGQLIRPRKARALLIEVDAPPKDEAYVIANGKIYIFRRYSKGQKPNDFVGRTTIKLGPEIERILAEEIEKL